MAVCAVPAPPELDKCKDGAHGVSSSVLSPGGPLFRPIVRIEADSQDRWRVGMVSMDAQWNSISAQLHGSFLDRQLRRTNRNLLLVSLLLMLAVVSYVWAERRYFYDFFARPFQADLQWLEGNKRPDDQLRYFISVKGEDSSDTGVQEVEQETQGGSVQRETVKAKYSILFLGNRLLIVKINIPEKGTVFQGELGEVPPDVRSNLIVPLVKEYPNVNQAFLPLMLDATGFRTEGYIALAICIPVVLFAVWLIRKVITRRTAPETHPIVKSSFLVRFAGGKPLSMQARQKKIDAILNLLVERTPWAVFGYSDELNHTLRTNWSDFVAAVDDRKLGGITIEHVLTAFIG
jgi:hypothetical protein